MKKLYFFTMFTLFALITNAQPTISSFSPSSGAIGTTVTINGTNFNATPANDIVYFGGVKAVVSAATTTSLTVTVPLGADYEYISVTNFTTNLTTYSNTPFHVTFGCNVSISSSSFAPKVDFTPGAHPVGIALGDVDGDGKLDIVIANALDNTVSILRNTSTTGTPSFAAKVDFAVGTYPYAVALGDLDGDGKLDLATANGTSNDMSVLRNTSTVGAVSFTTQIVYAGGTEPYSIAIGDLNADGKPDIAIANFNTPGLVSVYKNMSTLGSLSFSPKADFATGGHPKSIAIADIDGDGKPDLTSANYNSSSNSISILRNTCSSGTISFATNVDFSTGANPYAVAVGDLDGDGKPDIAVPNNGATTLSVFRNTSTVGSVSLAAKVDYVTGSSPVAVVIDDLDGDGKLDIGVANQFGNTVSLYENTCSVGTISFSPKVDFATSGVPYSLAIGDLDGDQRPDFATADASANLVSTLRNTECPLDIFNYELSSEVKIYPNPFTSQATIEIKDFKNDDYELHIYNLLGEDVLKSLITSELTVINRGELPSGIYFIQVRSKKEIIANQRVIIQN